MEFSDSDNGVIHPVLGEMKAVFHQNIRIYVLLKYPFPISATLHFVLPLVKVLLLSQF